jgi:Ca2+-binding RTX toxin-like protein
LLGSSLSVNDLIFRRSGTDLIINFKNNSTDSITVKYQFYYENNSTDKQYHRIEYIKFADNNDTVDLTTLKFDSNNDTSIWNGNSGNNTLIGAGDSDILIGGAGDDILVGNGGKDILRGGEGNDIFDFSSLKDSVVSAKDLIEDFEQGKDKIDLSGVEHHLAFDSLQFTFDNGNTTIKDQHSDFAIDLKGHFEMVQNDFIL